jgi:hypothetical protein
MVVEREAAAMKTVTIHTDIPESREVRVQLPDDVPSGPAELVIVIGQGDTAPAGTLGDLLSSEFVGMWSDRADIQDSAEFARQLRHQAWAR